MKFYLSHPIRGKYGKDATHAQMKENSDKAIVIANVLRATFPSIEIHCPAEHEDFVGIAYYNRYLTEKQVLEIDCRIIDGCEGVIIYVPEGDELQGGRLVEYEHALEQDKPIMIFAEVEQVTTWLIYYLLGV